MGLKLAHGLEGFKRRRKVGRKKKESKSKKERESRKESMYHRYLKIKFT